MDENLNAGSEPVEPSEPIEPEVLLKEFRERSEALDTKLDALQDMIQVIRSEIHSDSQQALTRLATAAHEMANGIIYQKIDIQAKGELGALVDSINQTLENLQQLDASVQHQSTQVPELAAQLDAITADTEQATQGVMNRLDVLMACADDGGKLLQAAAAVLERQQAAQARFQSTLDAFLERANAGENPARVAQEILEFLFIHQMETKYEPVDLTAPLGKLRTISDESFEILNTLQFQDITRQKVEKVVMLLKQFQGGLNRLLAIFKIHKEGVSPEVFERRHAATQDRIFDVSLNADTQKQSVDDIIAQFKKSQ